VTHIRLPTMAPSMRGFQRKIQVSIRPLIPSDHVWAARLGSVHEIIQSAQNTCSENHAVVGTDFVLPWRELSC
jgi:hypothetical protein